MKMVESIWFSLKVLQKSLSAKCKHIDNNGSVEILDDSVKETLTEKINEMSDNALRVLGIAYKKYRKY